MRERVRTAVSSRGRGKHLKILQEAGAAPGCRWVSFRLGGLVALCSLAMHTAQIETYCSMAFPQDGVPLWISFP